MQAGMMKRRCPPLGDPEDIHPDDFPADPEGLLSYLDKLAGHLPRERRIRFLESGMKLRVSSLLSQFEGNPGLKEVVEARYSRNEEDDKSKEVELTSERLRGTLDFIKNLSSFHPDKEAGFSLNHKLGSLMKALKGKEK